MIPAAIALIIVSMSSGENAETWFEKGAEAYARMRTAEAGEDFEKAVTADPSSARAHLSLGVIRFFEYLNGVAEAQARMENDMDFESEIAIPPTREETQARAEKRRAEIAEQNATHGSSAEEHLRRALQSEPRNQLATEYLAALYFWWRDPVTGAFGRQDEAKHEYERLLEINAQHPFANYMCGVIDEQRAMRMIRSNTGFPRPLADESRRRSLRAEAGPLLTQSARNFFRSLELEPNNRGAMTYLMLIRRDQAYIAETEEDAARSNAEADALQQRLYQIMEADAKATGQPWPPGDTGSITFVRIDQPSGEKLPVPDFPPDARFWAVPPGPLPPLPPSH